MKKFALPKSSLLRKSREFQQVYLRGKRLHGEGFSLIFVKSEQDVNRLGISVHRRIKGAVRRNRIKRIIRESFRLNRDVYPEHADIVFAVKPGFAKASPLAVTQAVSLLSRLREG